ncbi:AraC family transcriptional regulator [Bacillus sp. FJAT-25509]|uniref:response regulator transcription factor n=1 Tax=Bacillus sp. FJAT-25509 TaxID=1712029 RepID=UPI0006F895A3|nr:helix-turn-helix domain-containing protein [Bacillus sp. FJAT-25509]KQL32749.1 AraC family transcriptional regulator [Bacillus sp. FJAT-25509]
MLKVLIVDDEVLERKALTKIINGCSTDVRVIGEARNGRVAIEMTLQERPDIIFMDIKMPGIDGVQAVREIKKIDSSIRFIMVSAFNTFEYAKLVMQQGVKEFILKPSRKQDILESLQRVSAEILEERKRINEEQNLRKNLDRAVSIAGKEWVNTLLMNQVEDLTFDEWGELLGVEITYGYMMLFSLQEAVDLEHFIKDKQSWYLWLKESLKLVVKKYELMVGPFIDTQVPVIFLCRKTTEKIHFKTNAINIIEDICHLFQKEFFHAELRVGVGLPYANASELYKSYHEALSALQQLIKVPNQKFLFGNHEGNTEISTSTELFETEKQLLDALRQGDVNQVSVIYEQFVRQLSFNQQNNPKMISKSFDELFILVSRMLQDLGISYEQTPTINQSEDIKILFEDGKTYLLSVVRHVQDWRNNHAKSMLQKAKEYIELNYAEAINLELVADYVELSPFYFSKLFKDRFGMTFIDYLTKVRMKQAKTEMLDGGKSLKEICYSVGYKDPNYFSRVFKKHTGLSPSEFRKAIVS